MLFPMLDSETMAAMKSSIQRDGQHIPGVLDAENNELVAGRMRKQICDELGITFRYVSRKFSNEEEKRRFIFAENKDRRQFSLDQGAALIVYTYHDAYQAEAKEAMAAGGAKAAAVRGKGTGSTKPSDLSPSEASKPSKGLKERFHQEWLISFNRGRSAIKLFKEAQDLLQQVINGGMTLNQAIKALAKRSAVPKKKKGGVGQPNGQKNTIATELSPNEVIELEGQCEELADWVKERFTDTDSRSDAFERAAAYFRDERLELGGGAGEDGQEQAEAEE